MLALPQFRPDMSFDEACSVALDFLAVAIPMGYWSVSRHIAGRQLYLAVVDDAYGKVAGDSHEWSDSLCQYMVTGSAPQIAPDAMAIPKYAAAGIAGILPIGAYIGIPIQAGDGEVFGTLCGLDPSVKGPALFAEASTLRQVGELLARFLDADLARTRLARETELAEARRGLDAAASWMVTQSFWEDTLALEAPRLERFGDCAAVLAVAVAPDDLVTAAAALRRKTRASDLVAELGDTGFGILARDIVPANTPGLVARVETVLADSGVTASVTHRDISIKDGLTAAWQDVAPRLTLAV